MIVFLTQSAEVKKNPGSWSPSCLRGQPPRHSTVSSQALSCSRTSELQSRARAAPQWLWTGAKADIRRPNFYLDLHSHCHRNSSGSGFLQDPDSSRDSIPPGQGFRRPGLTRAPGHPDPGFGFRSARTQLWLGPNSWRKGCGSCPSGGSTRLPKLQL